jgi:putative PIN family toxin of toxin-antitoxin system
MRILVDTNVLISASLFPNPNMNQLMDRIALEHTLVLPSHVMEELEMLFDTKFKGKKNLLKRFFAKYSYDYVYTPLDINPEDYPEIRDKNDLPILVSAIVAGVDLIITGDKDFFDIKTRDIEIELPVIITPKEFIEGIK